MEYDNSLDNLPANKKILIQSRLIPSSVSFLKRALAAKRPVKRIHLYRQCTTPEVVSTERLDNNSLSMFLSVRKKAWSAYAWCIPFDAALQTVRKWKQTGGPLLLERLRGSDAVWS